MKRYYSLLLPLFAVALLSCQSKRTSETLATTDEDTQTFIYKDSCQHLVVRLSLEVPMGSDNISTQIRDSLIEEFIISAQQPGYYEEEDVVIKRYSGDKADVQALVDYYGKADYQSLLELAQYDYKERTEFLETDTTFSAEERNRIMNDIPQWEYDLAIRKTIDAPAFVVYHSQAYIYSGGAHGGVAGSGSLTFNKETGMRVQRFVKPSATKAMQLLIRKGLQLYYCEAGDTLTDAQLYERLQISDELIPLPSRTACPNAAGDSLTFTYEQYEIACYADGMPCFTLPVKDLVQFLTEEGQMLLIKK